MTLDEIITEQINMQVLKQYRDELRNYLRQISAMGNLQVNQAVAQAISQVQQFSFSIINAINSNNINPGQNPQGYIRNVMPNNNKNSSLKDSLINAPNDAYNWAREVGLNGLDPMLRGTYTSAVRGFYDTKNALGLSNNKQNQVQQVQTLKPTGESLTELIQRYPTFKSQIEMVDARNQSVLKNMNPPVVYYIFQTIEKIKQALETQQQNG